MSKPEVRVGIIADLPIQQHNLLTVIKQAGYEVSCCVQPQGLALGTLQQQPLDVWVIDLQSSEMCSDLFEELLQLEQQRVIFSDGEMHSKNSSEFQHWQRRLLNKLASFGVPGGSPSTDNDAAQSVSEASQVASFGYQLPTELATTQPQVQQVWVICASLGGPDAVKLFFDTIPANLPVAFVYSQHIDRTGLLALERSIGRHSQLEFKVATPGVRLQTGQVLIVPVDYEVEFRANLSVQLLNQTWPGPYSPCHDQVLSNLNRGIQQPLNCIIFSGMDDDGCVGAQLLSDNGGCIWGQSKASCINSSMPDNVYNTGVMSVRNTPVLLARQLIDYIRQLSQKVT